MYGQPDCAHGTVNDALALRCTMREPLATGGGLPGAVPVTWATGGVQATAPSPVSPMIASSASASAALACASVTAVAVLRRR